MQAAGPRRGFSEQPTAPNEADCAERIHRAGRSPRRQTNPLVVWVILVERAAHADTSAERTRSRRTKPIAPNDPSVGWQGSVLGPRSPTPRRAIRGPRTDPCHPDEATPPPNEPNFQSEPSVPERTRPPNEPSRAERTQSHRAARDDRSEVSPTVESSRHSPESGTITKLPISRASARMATAVRPSSLLPKLPDASRSFSVFLRLGRRLVTGDRSRSRPGSGMRNRHASADACGAQPSGGGRNEDRAEAGIPPALAGLVSGVLLWFAFPPADWGWLAWVALVPLFLLIRSRRSRAGDLPRGLGRGVWSSGSSRSSGSG